MKYKRSGIKSGTYPWAYSGIVQHHSVRFDFVRYSRRFPSALYTQELGWHKSKDCPRPVHGQSRFGDFSLRPISKHETCDAVATCVRRLIFDMQRNEEKT